MNLNNLSKDTLSFLAQVN